MKKIVAYILTVFFTINLYSAEYAAVKGIKWSEGASEVIIKKGEDIKAKTDKAVDNARIKAVNKVYPFKIEGNGEKSKIVQSYIFERAKVSIVKEFPAEWEREAVEDGSMKYIVKLKIGVKDRDKIKEKNSYLKIECDKKSYIEGEKIKFKTYCNDTGYISLFVFYDDKTVQKINFGKSNLKGYIENSKNIDELGEWGITDTLIPEGTGNEQVLYAIYTKEYLNLEEKYPDGKLKIEELAKEVEELKDVAESATVYEVISNNK